VDTRSKSPPPPAAAEFDEPDGVGGRPLAATTGGLKSGASGSAKSDARYRGLSGLLLVPLLFGELLELLLSDEDFLRLSTSVA